MATRSFGEGNTRTTAVFAIKYLRTMGYEVNNDPYRDHGWFGIILHQ